VKSQWTVLVGYLTLSTNKMLAVIKHVYDNFSFQQSSAKKRMHAPAHGASNAVHNLTASFFVNIPAKNYRIRLVYVKVIASQRSVVLGQCVYCAYICANNLYYFILQTFTVRHCCVKISYWLR